MWPPLHSPSKSIRHKSSRWRIHKTTRLSGPTTHRHIETSKRIGFVDVEGDESVGGTDFAAGIGVSAFAQIDSQIVLVVTRYGGIFDHGRGGLKGAVLQNSGHGLGRGSRGSRIIGLCRRWRRSAEGRGDLRRTSGAGQDETESSYNSESRFQEFLL
jgi:hypothetical protein